MGWKARSRAELAKTPGHQKHDNHQQPTLHKRQRPQTGKKQGHPQRRHPQSPTTNSKQSTQWKGADTRGWDSQDRDPVLAAKNTDTTYNTTRPGAQRINCWKLIAEEDLSGTAVQGCEITLVIQAALKDAVNALEKHVNQYTHPTHNTQTETYNPQTNGDMENAMGTPSAQLRLADETITAEERFDPTRNLADDLAMTTPAHKSHSQLADPNYTEKKGTGNEDDEEMEMANHFLREAPEDDTGPATKGDLQKLVAQIEGIRISGQDNRKEIDSLKREQAHTKTAIKKVNDLEATVQENAHAIMEHAVAIQDADKKTSVLMNKVDGAVLEVQKQGQKALSQFETLKTLIENQRVIQANTHHQRPTYAEKTDPRIQQRNEPRNSTDTVPRPVDDQRPPHHPSNDAPSLRKRGTGDRHLIDHHLEGLVTLYFTREMEGSIGAARAKINEHIGMNHIVKSINFLGDNDNNITEVCIPWKLARWFSHKVSTIKAADRVLGDEYVNCNPFVPRWDNMELIPVTVQQQRKPRHVKKILDQWYHCALRSQSEAVRAFYTRLLANVSKEGGRHLWAELAYDVIIDPTMKEYPKVVSTEKEAQHASKARTNKRTADEQHDAAINTPISANRKRKGRKTDNEDDDDEMETPTTTAITENEFERNSHGPRTDKEKAREKKDDTCERNALTENSQTKQHSKARPPAGPSLQTQQKNPQGESGSIAAGNKENEPPQ